MRITGAERDLYETVWSLPGYADHAPGEGYAALFVSMVKEHGFKQSGWRSVSVLDAGCGSGKGTLALLAAGFDDVMACDLTRDGLVPEAQAIPFVEVSLWRDLVAACGRHTWVYCTDVLEHLPPQMAALVVYRLLQCCRSGVFLSISLVPDVYGRWVGRPLHQTVMPYRTWLDTLNELGRVVDARDLGHTGVYLVVPR